MNTSRRVLKTLSAAVWLVGGVVLLLKGNSLILGANGTNAGPVWAWLAYPLGLILGWLKGTTVFSRRCRKNLSRIENLQRPKVWQFFSPGFFLALGVMIATGATLSSMAEGSYPFMIGVGGLDLALATALFVSSTNYLELLTFVEQG